MSKQSLVIIDMQPGFDSANDESTIEQVLVAITEAKQASLPIVIVECVPDKYGHTLDCIIEEVDFYDKVYFVEKFNNDGAEVIESVLHENDIEVSEHVVCGVNIGACVHDTVMSLMDDYCRNIIILQSACNCIHIERGTWDDYTDKESAFNHWPIYQRPEITLAGYPEWPQTVKSHSL